MTAPNMAAITASLERSFQNCSLNHHHHHESSSSSSNSGDAAGGGVEIGAFGRSSTSDSPETTLELNSQISLPYHWEQCLDLKTGEVYYINWRTGMKAKEDPRTSTDEFGGEDCYSEDGDSSYASEESSSESSPPPSSREQYYPNNNNNDNNGDHQMNTDRKGHVLVVAGCKSCLMYFMVPKQVQDCPKCCGQLLHFDRSENASP